MTPERIRELETGKSAAITEAEWAEGWRFCCEFDGMLLNCLDKENPEADICTCQSAKYPFRARASK